MPVPPVPPKGNTARPRRERRRALTAHRAAVKAIAWCPGKRHLLASGGGTADRTVKLWNTNTGALLHSANAGSQVTGLLWAKGARPQLLSSHGFSENQLSLWNWASAARRLDRVVDLRKHTGRVLAIEASPDGAKQTSKYGSLPLHIAVMNKLPDIARLLLEAYPEGAKRRNRQWKVPLHFAKTADIVRTRKSGPFRSSICMGSSRTSQALTTWPTKPSRFRRWSRCSMPTSAKPEIARQRRTNWPRSCDG